MTPVENLRMVFMGTASFAVPSLERLVEEGFRPIAVVTGPDRPRGRGQEVTFTPVKEAAIRLGVPQILQPEEVKDPAFASAVAVLEPDLIVVVAYRILPPEVYTCARLGAFNLHGSLLPRYRGAAPIQRAVMAGAVETGVTTFFLAQKVDTGNLILQRATPIGEDETAGEVHDRLMEIGADLVVETVQRILSGKVQTFVQDNALSTNAPKIFKEDCRIPWHHTARDVHNHIRGLSPVPGAWTLHGETLLKFFRSRRVEQASGLPGRVLEAGDRLIVACGEGAVEVLDLQQEGRRRMEAAAFVRGYNISPGDSLE